MAANVLYCVYGRFVAFLRKGVAYSLIVWTLKCIDVFCVRMMVNKLN